MLKSSSYLDVAAIYFYLFLFIFSILLNFLFFQCSCHILKYTGVRVSSDLYFTFKEEHGILKENTGQKKVFCSSLCQMSFVIMLVLNMHIDLSF